MGSNPAYKASELKHLLQISNANLLIVQDSELSRVLPAARDVGIAEAKSLFSAIKPQANQQKLRSWTDLLEMVEADWRAINDGKQSQETPVVLLSTSGTTGLPKMAAMSHFCVEGEGSFQSADVHVARLIHHNIDLCHPQSKKPASPCSNPPVSKRHT